MMSFKIHFVSLLFQVYESTVNLRKPNIQNQENVKIGTQKIFHKFGFRTFIFYDPKFPKRPSLVRSDFGHMGLCSDKILTKVIAPKSELVGILDVDCTRVEESNWEPDFIFTLLPLLVDSSPDCFWS